jgi:hypothetical protein
LFAEAIVLFLATSELGSPAAVALERAAQDAIGPDVRIELRRFAEGTPPTLGFACAEGSPLAVVAVAWAPAHLTASLRLRTCASGQEGTQTLRFEPRDPASERGRAVGVVIGAALRAASAQPAPPAEVVAPAPEWQPAPVKEAAQPGLRERFSLEAFAAGLQATGGAGSGLGGGMVLRLRPHRAWSFRLGARAHGGDVPAAQASLLGLTALLGVARTLNFPRGAMPAVSVRTDALLLHEALSHFSSDDPQPVRRSRFLPGASAGVELAWPIGPTLGLHAAAALEAAFGTTDIVVRSVKVARVGALRGLVEAGFRAYF